MTERSPLLSSSPLNVTTTRRSPIKTKLKITTLTEYKMTKNGMRIKKVTEFDWDCSRSDRRDVISTVMKIIHMIDLIQKITEIISNLF